MSGTITTSICVDVTTDDYADNWDLFEVHGAGLMGTAYGSAVFMNSTLSPITSGTVGSSQRYSYYTRSKTATGIITPSVAGIKKLYYAFGAPTSYKWTIHGYCSGRRPNIIPGHFAPTNLNDTTSSYTIADNVTQYTSAAVSSVSTTDFTETIEINDTDVTESAGYTSNMFPASLSCIENSTSNTQIYIPCLIFKQTSSSTSYRTYISGITLEMTFNRTDHYVAYLDNDTLSMSSVANTSATSQNLTGITSGGLTTMPSGTSLVSYTYYDLNTADTLTTAGYTLDSDLIDDSTYSLENTQTTDYGNGVIRYGAPPGVFLDIINIDDVATANDLTFVGALFSNGYDASYAESVTMLYNTEVCRPYITITYNEGEYILIANASGYDFGVSPTACKCDYDKFYVFFYGTEEEEVECDLYRHVTVSGFDFDIPICKSGGATYLLIKDGHTYDGYLGMVSYLDFFTDPDSVRHTDTFVLVDSSWSNGPEDMYDMVTYYARHDMNKQYTDPDNYDEDLRTDDLIIDDRVDWDSMLESWF